MTLDDRHARGKRDGRFRLQKGPELPAELQALEQMGIAALQAEWRRLYRTHPPKKLSRDMLQLAVAWKLQAQAGGGLSAGAARELADLADVLIGGADLPKARRVSIKPGARLVRERGGEMHEVLVIEDGFVWRDRTWKSLSVIAREMTGTRWSGPRFFGLDRAGGAGRAGIAVEGADA